MAGILYAAYGSNLHPERLRSRIATIRLVGHTGIDGYSLRFHKRGQDGSGKCNVVGGPGSLYVAVYELSHAGRERLHEIEGVGNGYEETRLRVPGFGDCYTYAASSTHIDDSLSPFTWYRQLVIDGCRFHGFPDDYVRALARVPAMEDPDRARHAEHADLLGRTTGPSAHSTGS